MPNVTMRELLEAGAHFGHHTRRWNPKMRQYIFGVRNGVHIIDLQQTVPMLQAALKGMRDVAANGGRILFVGTKRQAQEAVRVASKRCGQHYINHRWLGGMLTNWRTASNSIARLRELDQVLAPGGAGRRTKKEILMLTRERDKLEKSIGGIKEMGGLPDAVFVIDVTKEDIAIKEANRLGIPVFGVIDTNCDPKGVDFPFPGNDDALRAIELYCSLTAEAILDGLQASLASRGGDIGASANPGNVLAGRKGKGKKADEAEAPAAAAGDTAEEEPKKQATA
jgi:small subunit ribosomal protein S2